MKAATSEPRKFSPSPMPTTSGLLRRAATTRSGSCASTATRVNAPSRPRQTACMATVRSTPVSSCSSSRWAATSVSVSEAISTPSASSRPRSSAKFSMMPLCTSATRRARPRCGWALRSFGAPWVAHRVWPMPVVTAGSGDSAIAFSRLASLPARLSATIDPASIEGDPGGVVAAVLQPPQALDHHALGRLRTHVSDDSAHGRGVYRQACARPPRRRGATIAPMSEVTSSSNAQRGLPLRRARARGLGRSSPAPPRPR